MLRPAIIGSTSTGKPKSTSFWASGIFRKARQKILTGNRWEKKAMELDD
jgi:hypothetical protein